MIVPGHFAACPRFILKTHNYNYRFKNWACKAVKVEMK